MFKDARVIRVNPKHHSVDIEYRATTERIRDVKCLGRIYWNLQPGDYVLVGFIDNLTNPVVIDKVLLRGDPRITSSALDDIHLIHEVGPRDDNGILTEITGRIEVQTDKDGNLSLTLSGKLGTLNLKALGDQGNVNIEAAGNLNISVKGDAVLDVTGKATVTAGGDVEISAEGKVKVDGAMVELGENALGALGRELVNNLPTCLLTGAPHQIGNTKVTV